MMDNSKDIKISGDIKKIADDLYYVFYMNELLAVVWQKVSEEINIKDVFKEAMTLADYGTESYEDVIALMQFDNQAKSKLFDEFSTLENPLLNIEKNAEDVFNSYIEQQGDFADITFKIAPTSVSFQYVMQYENQIPTLDDKIFFGAQIVDNLNSKIETLEKVVEGDFFTNQENGVFQFLKQEAYQFFELFTFADYVHEYQEQEREEFDEPTFNA